MSQQTNEPFLEELYTQIYLIFPNGIAGREHLCNLYLDLIDALPSSLEVVLFTSDSADFEANWRPRITRTVLVVEEGYSDIWLGDYFPYRVDERRFLGFGYVECPSDQAKLARHLGISPIELGVNLDLGSLEIIGDTLLVSTDIYDLNPSIHPEEVENRLKQEIGVSEVVVLKSPTSLTHIDTQYRVFHDIVLYNPAEAPSSLTSRLKRKYKNEYLFCPTHFSLSGEVAEEIEGFVDSYVGNPFDFLVIGCDILFPVVTDSDRSAFEMLCRLNEEEGLELNLRAFEHPDLAALYRLGGGLFCISGLY